MKILKNTWVLVRLALRRDRILLPVWLLLIAAMTYSSVSGVVNDYSSPEQRAEYTAASSAGIIPRIIHGPTSGAELGAVMFTDAFSAAAIVAIFMSILLIVRHTRQNEETGRAELLSSAPVGRFAPLTAALLVAFGANVIVGGLVTAVYMVVGKDLPIVDSLGAGMAVAAVGMVFAAVAALTAQVLGNARGANSLAGAVLGAAFLLRATGDSLGHMTANGMAVVSAWPSWLSPLGWAQQLRPFSENNWGVFGLLGGLFIIIISVAYICNARRDLGLGMIPARRGPAVAAKSLLSPLGLAWRLQKGTFFGWAIGIIALGSMFGVIAHEFKDLVNGEGQATPEVIFSFLMGLMVMAVAGYAIQTLLRMRAEEATGHIELVLAGSVSRSRWMISHMVIAFSGMVLLLILLGASTGIAYAFVGSGWSYVPKILQSAIIFAPALATVIGFIVLIFGVFPRLTTGFAWGSLTVCILISMFGKNLNLSQWIMDISPFTHIPATPLTGSWPAPLLILGACCVVFTLTGLVLFRRRDMVTA